MNKMIFDMIDGLPEGPDRERGKSFVDTIQPICEQLIILMLKKEQMRIMTMRMPSDLRSHQKEAIGHVTELINYYLDLLNKITNHK